MNQSRSQKFCPTVICAMVWALAMLTAGCSGIEPIPDTNNGGQTFVELDVEPDDAEVFIDGEYTGRVNRWAHQMVPVEPGVRQLEIRADGYISQRFDVDIDEGRTVTLRTRLEPDIATPDGERLQPGDDDFDAVEDDERDRRDDNGVTAPQHPTAPD